MSVRFRRQGGTVWHFARHSSTGYGIHGLCGYSLSESAYTTRPNKMRITRECRRCRLAAGSSA